jgi:hypothetical protein
MAALVSPGHFAHPLSVLHDPERGKSDDIQATTCHPTFICLCENNPERPAVVPCRTRECSADVVGASPPRRLERQAVCGLRSGDLAINGFIANRQRRVEGDDDRPVCGQRIEGFVRRVSVSHSSNSRELALAGSAISAIVEREGPA